MKKNKKAQLFAIFVVHLVLGSIGLFAANINIGGSTTILPIIQAAEAGFESATGHDLTIILTPEGSGYGYSGVVDDSLDIGMISRELTSDEILFNPDVLPVVIGQDAIAVIVNKANAVNDLTLAQVRDIFLGNITDWSTVGGAAGAIQVETRTPGSGTLSAFKSLVLDDNDIVAASHENASNSEMRTSVAANISAIGFVSLGYLDGTVQGVSISGVAPTPANANNGAYPVVRPLNLATKGLPSDAEASLLYYITGAAGQTIMESNNYLPASPTTAFLISGSTTVEPITADIVNKLLSSYTFLTINITASGSSAGISDLIAGTADLAMSSRALKQTEIDAGCISHPVASDAISVVVNPANPVTVLTSQQVIDIFTGVITNWSAFGGPNTTINIQTRDANSGTLATFKELALGGADVASSATEHASNSEMAAAVAADNNAIGFVGFSYLDSSITGVAIDAIPPALSTGYPYFRYLYLVTLSQPIGLADLIIKEHQDFIHIGGSTTVLPIVLAAKNGFEQEYGGYKLLISAGGSSSGFKGSMDCSFCVGMMSRALKESEVDENPWAVATTIGKDGIAVIVNNANSLTNLTSAEVKDIFTGLITDWGTVGGPVGPINVQTRESSSGTLAAFRELALDNEEVMTTATAWASNGELKAAVAADPRSIGFISLGYLDLNVTGVVVDFVTPSIATAKNGLWPYVRPLNLVTRNPITDIKKKLLYYITSHVGQVIVENEGFIPVSPTETFSIQGSTTVYPLTQAKVTEIKQKHSYLDIEILGTGSGSGISATLDEIADLGMSSREITSSELGAGIVHHVIDIDAIAVIVNSSNPLTGLSGQEVKYIFTGVINNWNMLGGPDAPINVQTREKGSGTLDTFMSVALDGLEVVQTATAHSSNGEVQAAVIADPNAIGFVGFSYLDQVTPVTVDGIEPTMENAENGTYSYVRNLYLVTKGEPQGLTQLIVMDHLPAPVIGDADNDGEVTVVDALITAQSYINIAVPSSFNPGVADIDCDGEITIIDALGMARFYIELITEFPCQTCGGN